MGVSEMFKIVLILASILYFLPWICAFIHSHINHQLPPIIIYYRYFVFFNLIVMGLLLMLSVFTTGHDVAHLMNWHFNPIFEYYGISVLSMVLMTLIIMWSCRHIIVAPLILWSVFLLIDNALHIQQLIEKTLPDVYVVYEHLTYNFLVFVTLIGFGVALKKRFTDTGVIRHGREAYTA